MLSYTCPWFSHTLSYTYTHLSLVFTHIKPYLHTPVPGFHTPISIKPQWDTVLGFHTYQAILTHTLVPRFYTYKAILTLVPSFHTYQGILLHTCAWFSRISRHTFTRLSLVFTDVKAYLHTLVPDFHTH